MKKNKAFAVFCVSSFLLVCFVVLKLIGAIAWDWWIVLAPYWVPLVALVIIFCVVLIRKDGPKHDG